MFGSVVKIFNSVTGAVLDIADKFKLKCARIRSLRAARQQRREAESTGDRYRTTRAGELRRSTINVEQVFQRRLSADLRDDTLSTIGGLSSLLMGGIGGAIDKATTAISAITGFFKAGAEQKAMIDDFIGIDTLLAELNKYHNLRYFDLRTDEDKKEFIRKEALKRLLAPSFEVFFTDLAARYARCLHRHIFAGQDGTAILSSDTAEIESRASFCSLFPGVVFKYPDTAEQPGSPTTEELAELITKG